MPRQIRKLWQKFHFRTSCPFKNLLVLDTQAHFRSKPRVRHEPSAHFPKWLPSFRLPAELGTGKTSRGFNCTETLERERQTETNSGFCILETLHKMCPWFFKQLKKDTMEWFIPWSVKALLNYFLHIKSSILILKDKRCCCLHIHGTNAMQILSKAL